VSYPSFCDGLIAFSVLSVLSHSLLFPLCSDC
jgi:hypothetical protein